MPDILYKCPGCEEEQTQVYIRRDVIVYRTAYGSSGNTDRWGDVEFYCDDYDDEETSFTCHCVDCDRELCGQGDIIDFMEANPIEEEEEEEERWPPFVFIKGEGYRPRRECLFA